MTILVGQILFQLCDSLLAFKAQIVYCAGLYIMMILKILYSSPRPFWVKREIRTYFQFCNFDFASPSQHVFNITFFWVYCIFMYQQKYTPSVNYTRLRLMYGVMIFMLLITGFAQFVFGISYSYQLITSILYSGTYLVVSIELDGWIQN